MRSQTKQRSSRSLPGWLRCRRHRKENIAQSPCTAKEMYGRRTPLCQNHPKSRRKRLRPKPPPNLLRWIKRRRTRRCGSPVIPGNRVMERGTYTSRRVDFSKLAAAFFDPHLFIDPRRTEFGCGASALALLTGIAPEVIAKKHGPGKHYADRFMIGFLRANGFTVERLTLCRVSNGSQISDLNRSGGNRQKTRARQTLRGPVHDRVLAG